MKLRRPSRNAAVNHFVALATLMDDQARTLLRHHGGHPDAKKLDQWAVKIRQDLEKSAATYFRVFDTIDSIIDGPPTPRTRR